MNANEIESKQEKQALNQKPRLKGFGYLYRRGTIWWVRYSIRGKDFRESSGSERDRDAMKLLKLRWQELGRGRFIGPAQERVTMEELFKSLEMDYSTNGRRSFGTLKGRLVHLRAAFVGLRAVDVTEQKIENYKQMRLAEKTMRGNKPIQSATVNRELSMLRKAFRLAVRQRRIAAAPSIDLLAENNVRQGFIEPPDLEKVVSALPNHLRDFTRFAYITGWRVEKFVDWNGRKLIGNQRRFFLGVQKMESRGFFLLLVNSIKLSTDDGRRVSSLQRKAARACPVTCSIVEMVGPLATFARRGGPLALRPQ